MLGPDEELLTTILLDLGEIHEKLGVTASMYPPLGLALVDTLRDLLGKQCFTPAVQIAWMEVYNAISADMILGKNDLQHEKKPRSPQTLPPFPQRFDAT